MARGVTLLLLGGLLLSAGCPNADTAFVEHGNVCIDLSPDGNFVVFSSADGDLYLFEIATRTTSRLTETERTESYPSFSPDGKRVVFSAAVGNVADIAPYDIYTLELSSLTVEQVTDGSGFSDILPRFRPDGKRIVFARAYRNRPYSLGGWTWDNWDVCEVGTDGAGFNRLTTAGYYRMNRVVPRSDGSIIYAAVMGGDNGLYTALYEFGAAEEPRRLIPAEPMPEADVYAWASDPMIAPDGDTLTYCSDRERPFWYDVCVSTVDSEAKCLVGAASRYNRYPDFFPDGRRILFLAGTEFNAGSRPIYELWEVSLAGQTKQIAPSDVFTNPGNWLSGPKSERPGTTAPASWPESDADEQPAVR